MEKIARRIGAVVNGDTDLVITAEVECLNASDEGGGNLELFGTIDVSILDARGDVVWEENMFSVPGSGKYVVLEKKRASRLQRRRLSRPAGLILPLVPREQAWQPEARAQDDGSR